MSDILDVLDGEPIELENEVPEQAETPQAPVEQEEPQVEATAEAADEATPEPAETPEPAKLEDPAPSAQSEAEKGLLGVVRTLRQQNRDLEAKLSQQSPEPVPDMFEDPQGFQQHVTKSAEQLVSGRILEQSKFLATREFGEEVVDEALAYFDDHPEQSHRLMNHPSPMHAAVEFVKAQKIAQEIGNDPAAYREKVRAEIRAEIEQATKAKLTADAVLQAPSLASQTNMGNRSTAPAPPTSVVDELFG